MKTQDPVDARSLLDVRGIRGRSGRPGTLVDGNLDLPAGEIRALLGTDRAATSVLVNILAGVEDPERGQVTLEGQPLSAHPEAVTTMAIIGPQAGSITFAISRAVRDGAKVLVLDDPITDLPAVEVRPLFRLLRRLRDDGLAVLLVTQRLDAVYEVCDSATVLRDGETVGTYRLAALPRRLLVGIMEGAVAAVLAADVAGRA